jgi:hypothetical protein
MAVAAGLIGPIFNAADGTVTMSAWMAVIASALVALAIILAVVRTGIPAALALAALLLAAGGSTWIWLDHQSATARHAVESRFAELQARAQAPGSVLSCLDAGAGDAVDAGCELSLFSSPENLATASSYITALFALTTEAQRIASRRNSKFERDVERTRRTLEQDRFGLLANHLAVQEGCTAERCDLLVLLHDPTKVQANLEQRTFDTQVAHYAANWGPQAARAAASAPAGFTIGSAPAPASAPLVGAQAAPPNAKPLPPDYVLPSSESIPAISIMSNEPAREAARASTPSDTGQVDTAVQPRRPQRAAQARSRSANDGSAPSVGVPLALTQ